MRHLGTAPKWVPISGKVDFPEEIRRRYSDLIGESVANFEKVFSQKLEQQQFTVLNMVVQPRGLKNVGNMCFANSSLQLLFASPHFVSFAHFMRLQLPLFSQNLRKSTPYWHSFCQFLDNFKFSDSGSSDGSLPSLKSFSLISQASPLSTAVLNDLFGPFSSTRKPRDQEDAFEFLSYFLNALHEELVNVIKMSPTIAKDTDEGGWSAQGTNRGTVPVQETHGDFSPLTTIFATLVTADTLSYGRTRSMATEVYLVLPLPIVGIHSINDALMEFMSEERINKEVSKKNSFKTLPMSLILGLKRFGYNEYGPTKLTQIVTYPEVLSIDHRFVAQPLQYQLSAIVEHIGTSPGAGHYICYARRFDGIWMKFDDDKVTVLNDGEHLDRQAYLLLYNRITSICQTSETTE